MPQPNIPILGQPFTIVALSVPVNAQVRCNCGGAETDVAILLSVPAACPSCRKVYYVAINPATQQVEVAMSLPEETKVPS